MRTRGAASPPKQVPIRPTRPPAPAPLTRLKLRPQDSRAVSTRFLSAENIFRMLRRGVVSRSVGAKVTKIRARCRREGRGGVLTS